MRGQPSTQVNEDRPDEWIDVNEAAEIIGCRPRTLHSWRGSTPQRGPASTKYLGKVRYKRADVEAWKARELAAG